jgi:hypothetical protein
MYLATVLQRLVKTRRGGGGGGRGEPYPHFGLAIQADTNRAWFERITAEWRIRGEPAGLERLEGMTALEVMTMGEGDSQSQRDEPGRRGQLCERV